MFGRGKKRKVTHKSAAKSHMIKASSGRKMHLRNQLHHHDHEFVRTITRYFKPLKKYFRYKAISIENIPRDKKCLVVMNHGIIPYHGFLLTHALVTKRKIYPRGLGAGFLFDIPGLRTFFLKGGAVNANNHNAKQLLNSGACVLLSPGGIYEGLVARPGMKRIPWERRTGFVKLACETNTPIVPTYCAGINNVYFNSKFLLKLRIKILEKIRFSMPIFWGLGLLPFPIKLDHHIGKPISVRRLKGESDQERVKRIHKKVLDSMNQLQTL